MKLYATLETSRGKTVSVSDNETITATVYDGNMKAYSVTIDWCDVGDGQTGAIITTREWRNRPKTNDKKEKCSTFGCNNLSQSNDPKCPAHAKLADMGIY
jgi:hypothetical protein